MCGRAESWSSHLPHDAAATVYFQIDEITLLQVIASAGNVEVRSKWETCFSFGHMMSFPIEEHGNQTISRSGYCSALIDGASETEFIASRILLDDGTRCGDRP